MRRADLSSRGVIIGVCGPENSTMRRPTPEVSCRVIERQKTLKPEETQLIKKDLSRCNNVSNFYCSIYIQGVPGGKDLTSGECSLDQTIPI
jgi:hypothetical protein